MVIAWTIWSSAVYAGHLHPDVKTLFILKTRDDIREVLL